MFSRVALCLALACLPVTVGAAQSPDDAPSVVRASCTTCHGLDIIRQQRLGSAGWERELDKMIRWGANVSDADRPALLRYLQHGAGMLEAPAQALAERGAELFGERCLVCHGEDIVQQQRLSGAGWRREVDKMTAWGARVVPEERDAVVAYLAARFGPK